ncbi:MAG: universal stress protein [Myxococcota bacterium]
MAARHILVCTDFSDPSKAAIAVAAEEANAHGSKTTLLHVIDANAFVPPQSVLRPQEHSEDESSAKAKLDALRDELLQGADTVVLVDRAPAKAICDFANENGVELIVCGSRGQGPVERWLIGSVAERIVRHAECSVYVVR